MSNVLGKLKLSLLLCSLYLHGSFYPPHKNQEDIVFYYPSLTTGNVSE